MGRAPCCDKANVKRGPWSPEEDVMLKTYVERYGTGGNWIALPQKAGLKRCGKSCRLRWLNYLRPDIKHGGFTEEEDNIICSLYKSIGSRWSVIASQLPGRTDNDVKNYWNTKLKKKLLGPKPIIDQFGQDHLVHTTTTMKSNSSSSSSTSSPSRSTLTIQTPNIIPKLEGSPYRVSNFSYSNASYEENNTSGGLVDFTNNSCVREPQNYVSQDMFSFETRSAVMTPTNIRLPTSEFCFTSTQGLSPTSTDMSYISWFLNGIGDDGLAIMDFVNGSSSNQINGGGFPEQKVLDVGDSSFCNHSSQLNSPYSSLMSNPDINQAQSQWLYQSIYENLANR